jgi:predicted nucleic acid-binding protein
VIVKALIHQTSWAAQVFDAFLVGQFILATSESILEEIRRTLYKPKLPAVTGPSPEEIEEFIVLLRGTGAPNDRVVRNSCGRDRPR